VDGVLLGCLVAAAGYAIGSVPFAYLVARTVAGVDIRVEGEGNPGARNVFHVVGQSWGVLVFVLDSGKGALLAAVLVVAGTPAWLILVGGAGLLFGHAYPVWLGFQGGKGAASAAGYMTALPPLPGLEGAALAALTFGFTRRFHPATVVGMASFLGVFLPLHGVPLARWLLALAILALPGLKRVLDERRMREVEHTTGWYRPTGGFGNASL